MVFSSLTFVCLFLPVTAAVYFLSIPRLRNQVLVAASMIFYAWGVPLALVLVLFLIVLNFYLGKAIEVRYGRSRQSAISAAIGLNLLIFVFFKYADFLVANLNDVLSLVSVVRVPSPHIAAPLGISFFTFHVISYLVDVYRGNAKAQQSLTAFSLYIINFPQLIAGPIIRYRQIADQLQTRATNFSDVDAGIGRFTIGLAKKLLIANPIGAIADQVFFIPPEQLSAGSAWLGVICYGLQIYFDFSGYSDMAIGLARIFGFRFPENFNYPYSAQSMQDFWRRWHITLSLWFRDYVYIPLGGNRHGAWSTTRNLWIVFILAGAWHGASWNFIVWGLWQGLFLSLERLSVVEAIFMRSPRLLRHVYTIFVIFVGWVFFRSPNLEFACGYLARMFGIGLQADGQLLSVDVSPPMLVLIAAACCMSLPLWPRLSGLTARMSGHTANAVVVDLGRAALVALAMVLSLSTMEGEQYNPFIYFNF